MKKSKLLLSFLAALCVLAAHAADNGGGSSAFRQQVLSGDKAAVALDFINAYVENCLAVESRADVVTWVGSSPLTTDGFKCQLQRMVDRAAAEDPELGLDFDPLFDAQDFPDGGFVLESADRQDGYLILRGKDWPEFKLAVKMINERGKWLVEGCGAVNIPDRIRFK